MNYLGNKAYFSFDSSKNVAANWSRCSYRLLEQLQLFVEAVQ
jgi:hypothetical protein